MSEPAKEPQISLTDVKKSDFERVKELFSNPQEALNDEVVESAEILLRALLGKPMPVDIDPSTSSELIKFAESLAVKMQGSRHFDHLSMAQLHPNGNIPAILAHIASTLRNNNTIIGEVSPVETRMEVETVDWLLDKISGYDTEKASGAIVTGGTLANLTALMVAREKLSMNGWDGVTPAFILCTKMAHYSIKKAAAVLSPGRYVKNSDGGYQRKSLIEVIEIPMENGTFRMDVKELGKIVNGLKKAGAPIMAVVGVAGETETGLVDDLKGIGEVAQNNGIYYHIDAAYGGPFAISRNKALFHGIEMSDSITIDPHKYLYTPYAAGAVLFKSAEDHSLLEQANEAGAGYMFKEGDERQAHSFKDESQTHLGKRRIEGSMGGQGTAAAWAVIKAFGAEGLKSLLDHSLDLTDAAYRSILASEHFKVAHVPDLNTICFYPFDERIERKYRGNAGELLKEEEYKKLIEKVSARLEQEHGIYISTTTLPIPTGVRNNRTDRKVLRFVATHPYTESKHVQQALDTIYKLWDEIVENLTEK